MHACMTFCMYTGLCVCLGVCMHVTLCVYVYMCVCCIGAPPRSLYGSLYVWHCLCRYRDRACSVYVCIHVCMYIWKSWWLSGWLAGCMYVCMSACMYVCAAMYVCVCVAVCVPAFLPVWMYCAEYLYFCMYVVTPCVHMSMYASAPVYRCCVQCVNLMYWVIA